MLLAVPEQGLSRSVEAHNINFEVFCDWLEASALFLGNNVSGADIVDLLCENEIYRDQDFAWEFISNAFAEIRSRVALLGVGYPIRMSGSSRIVRVSEWREYPAYSFCLALSLRKFYPHWAKAFGSNYNEQGELFEKLTAESVSHSFRDWKVHLTGWTETTPSKLGKIVDELAEMLGEGTGERQRWTRPSAKEAGLDIVCFRPFPDGRAGYPVYLFQCASGADWPEKLKTPDLRIWTKLISFASDPKKAFSMPYALDTNEFTRNTNVVDGLLLDRYRLLAPGLRDKNWLSIELAGRLIEWISHRIPTLPEAQKQI